MRSGQKEFCTLTEFIHQVNFELGVDESDPECQTLLRRAVEEPDVVMAELSLGFGVSVRDFVTEPNLSIDWILLQLPT